MDGLNLSALTMEERSALQYELKRKLARFTFIDYCRLMVPGWEEPPHIVLCCEYLEKLARGEITKLMLLLPPRHGKTTLVRAWIQYFYGLFPRAQVISTSYSTDIPQIGAREIRAALRDDKYPFETRIARDSSSVERMATEQGGIMLSTGVGGAATGYGYHAGICDDLVRSAADAASDAIMDSTWSWYNTTFGTRKMIDPIIGPARELIANTVWSAKDVPSRILEGELAHTWTVLRLPARSEGAELDPLQRPLNAPLWPSRYDEKFLAEQEIKLGTKAFSALYQNLPLGGDGGLLKDEWFPRYSQVPANLGKAIVVDTSYAKSNKSDFTVIFTIGVAPDGTGYLLDVIRQRLQWNALFQTMMDIVQKNRGIPLYIEDAVSGQSLCQALRAAGIRSVVPMQPKGTKQYRHGAMAPLIQAGIIHIPEHAPWLTTFLREVLANEPVYDDQLDCLGYACDILVVSRMQRQQPQRRIPNPFDM